MDESTEAQLRKIPAFKLQRNVSSMSNLHLNVSQSDEIAFNEANGSLDLESHLPMETDESQEHYKKTNYMTRLHNIFKSYYKLLLFLLLTVIGFFIVIQSSTIYQKSATQPNLTHHSSVTASGKRSFTIENVLNGDFIESDSVFEFIKPPRQILDQNEDPGLYFTTEITKDDTHKIVAKQLYNEKFSKDIMDTIFIYAEKEYRIESIELNYNLSIAIIGAEIEPEYRHSSNGLYFIYLVESRNVIPIYLEENSDVAKLSYAHFSPAYNFIYFVYNNDLYFMDIKDRRTTRVTNNGDSLIQNGKSCWVYEEEVLATDVAVWWAPDDSKYVFATFDQSDVNSITFPLYTKVSTKNFYSSIRYPLPGSANPKVSLFMYNVEQNVLSELNLDEELKELNNDIIVYSASWLTSNSFLFKVSDRASKILDVLLFDSQQNKLMRTRRIDSSSYNGWIEKLTPVTTIYPNSKVGRQEFGYIDIVPDNSGYKHLCYFPSITSSIGKQLTFGNWEVTGSGIVGFDYETDTIFFNANKANSFSQQLFAVTLDSSSESDLETLQNPENVHDYYEFTFSSSCRYAISRKMGPNAPISKVSDLIDVLKDDKSEFHGIYLNNPLKMEEKLKNFDIPVTSYKQIETDDGVLLDYVEIKPANMNPNKKYPLLVNVYGGPGSRTVTSRFGIQFERAVSSGLDAIVIQIEPRGTGNKGWNFKSWAKNKIGYWEPRDIIEVTRKFIATNKEYIDNEKVAIWGWSYGGFSTLKTVELDEGNIFKYAMAVAPVTNWVFYDSIYTERYMDTPLNNPDGYNNLSQIKNINSFKSLKRLLLIHGTADENVHIKNTYLFSDALNMNDISNYDLHIYPDSGHSIVHHNDFKMVYRRLYTWLEYAINEKF